MNAKRSQSPLLLVGSGGHAAACIDVIEQEGCHVVGGLVGLAEERGKRLLGYEVVGVDADLPALLDRYPAAFVVVGQIRTAEPRVRLFEYVRRLGYALPTIVSPFAYVSPHAMLGPGTIVMHGAVVNAEANVGANCIINSRALVEHHVVIEDHCHVATGAVLNGGARVGIGTFVGSGSTVRERVVIGERCLIGMGQRVLADCDTGTRLARERTP